MSFDAYLSRLYNSVENIEHWSELAESPLLSVGMTTYNHEVFVTQAVDSVLMQQTTFDYEIVIAEDNSTDRTRKIVLDFQKSHPDKIRLRLAIKNLYSQGLMPGIGVRAACRGKYIALLEGDDFWTDPFKLQKQVDLLEANPSASLCFANVGIASDLCENKKRLYGTEDEIKRGLAHCKKPSAVCSFGDLLSGMYIYTSSVVMRKTIVDECLADSSALMSSPAGDFPLFLMAAQNGSLMYIDESMSCYRLHSGGVWSSLDEPERLRREIEVLIKCSEDVLFDESVRDGCRHRAAKIAARLLLDVSDASMDDEVCSLFTEEQSMRFLYSALLDRSRVKRRDLISLYETSTSFRAGRCLLKPLRLLKGILYSR